jgi:hypothetical protein
VFGLPETCREKICFLPVLRCFTAAGLQKLWKARGFRLEGLPALRRPA